MYTPDHPNTRLPLDTGLLTRGIMINNLFLLVESCDVAQNQEIVMKQDFLQGGPLASIANIGSKKISGSINTVVYVEKDGTIDPAIGALISNAENPSETITIDTNHALSHVIDITGCDPGTNNNQLLSFDNVVVTRLEISCSEKNVARLVVTFEGKILLRASSAWLSVPADFASNLLLRNVIHWADCYAGRAESDMRGVVSLKVTIENRAEKPAFIPSISETVPDDQIGLIATHTWQWTGSYDEVIPIGLGINSMPHGGWMVEEDLRIGFGPVEALFRTPVFEKPAQPYGASIRKRSIKFYAQTSPQLGSSQGTLFSYPEE